MQNNECLSIEIKFHRKATKSTLPHTAEAGDIFNDLLRLSCLCPSRRLFLYVTDCDMNQYLNYTGQDPYRKNLHDFYQLQPGAIWTCKWNNVRKTFTKSALSGFTSIVKLSCVPPVKLLCKADFPISSISFKGEQCFVRLYEVVD